VKTPGARCRLIAVGMCAVTAACGRIGFEAGNGAGNDAGMIGKAPVDACTFGPWNTSALQPFSKINTTATEWGAQISADGLHVVFSSDRNDPEHPNPGGDQKLYIAQRASLDVEFEAPAYIAKLDDLSDNPRDPTFTPDLLELYFVADGVTAETSCAYVSQWTTATAAWSSPIELAPLCPPPSGALGGIYLSDDGLRLYYDTSAGGKPSVLQMTSRPARDAMFTSAGEAVAGLSHGLGYCALSADERTIACESDTSLSSRPQLWQAARPTRDAPFGPAAAIPELLDATQDDGDPSFTADGTQLVYAAAVDGNNDLRVAERTCQ
jgi:hypothetical protein